MKTENVLINKFFHSFHENGLIKWQGKIIGEPKENHFLIQLHSFIDGEPTDQIIIHIEQMFNWNFYSTEENWIIGYNKKHRPAYKNY